eukprot:scaffold57513_cov52-Phaeocystis_antarctica.AAC.1
MVYGRRVLYRSGLGPGAWPVRGGGDCIWRHLIKTSIFCIPKRLTRCEKYPPSNLIRPDAVRAAPS